MLKNEQQTTTVLPPLSTDAARLYGMRSKQLKAMLRLADAVISEHSSRQATNISSYSFAGDMARAMGAASDLLRALGVPQQTIERTVSGVVRE